MAKSKKIVLVFVALIIATGTYLAYQTFYHPTPDRLQATGTIEATQVNVNAKSLGTLKSISVQEGDRVQSKQLLGEIYRSDLLAQRERDALSVLAAEARLKGLVSGARAQEIEQAVSNLNIAQISKVKADQDLTRVKSLFEAGGFSQDKLEDAHLNADLKKHQLDLAQSQLSLLQAGNRPEVISVATAELQRAKAIVGATDVMLEDLKLYAPISGMILSKNYETGEFVQMGTSILTIADLDHLWVNVYIPTDDLPSVKLGQKVHLTVSGDSTVHSGTVAHIASQGEFTPKTIQTKKERTNVVFAVKINVENKNGLLKPGMPADVVFADEE